MTTLESYIYPFHFFIPYATRLLRKGEKKNAKNKSEAHWNDTTYRV